MKTNAEIERLNKQRPPNGNFHLGFRLKLNTYFLSGVGIAQSVQQWAMGWTAWVRLPAVQDFPLLHNFQTDSGAHPVSYPMSNWGFLPKNKAAEP
jgi:hypothetical protein